MFHGPGASVVAGPLRVFVVLVATCLAVGWRGGGWGAVRCLPGGVACGAAVVSGVKGHP